METAVPATTLRRVLVLDTTDEVVRKIQRVLGRTAHVYDGMATDIRLHQRWLAPHDILLVVREPRLRFKHVEIINSIPARDGEVRLHVVCRKEFQVAAKVLGDYTAHRVSSLVLLPARAKEVCKWLDLTAPPAADDAVSAAAWDEQSGCRCYYRFELVNGAIEGVEAMPLNPTSNVATSPIWSWSRAASPQAARHKLVEVIDASIAPFSWVAARHAPTRIATWITADMLADRELVPCLERTLDRHGLTPNRLTLGLFDWEAAARRGNLSSWMRSAAVTGFRLALADMGLERNADIPFWELPCHELRLSMRALRDAADDSTVSAGQLRRMVRIARAVGLTVSAPLGPQEALLETVRQHGCAVGVTESRNALITQKFADTARRTRLPTIDDRV